MFMEDVKLKYNNGTLGYSELKKEILKRSIQKVGNIDVVKGIVSEHESVENVFEPNDSEWVSDIQEYGIGSTSMSSIRKNDNITATLMFDENNHDNGIIEYTTSFSYTTNDDESLKSYEHSCTGAYSFLDPVYPRIKETISKKADHYYDEIEACFHENLTEFRRNEFDGNNMISEVVYVNSNNTLIRKVTNGDKVSYGKCEVPAVIKIPKANKGAYNACEFVDSLDYDMISELGFNTILNEILESRKYMISSDEGRVAESQR